LVDLLPFTAVNVGVAARVLGVAGAFTALLLAFVLLAFVLLAFVLLAFVVL
jgi:hypothetical protein